jgi:cystathionine beta-lyase/cystathionine gamma-synthase
MASGNHTLRQRSRNPRAVALRTLVALLFGVVAVMTLATPVLQYMNELGADILVAALTALTPR